MNLQHFFGLIMYSVFQRWDTITNWQGEKVNTPEEAYNIHYFYCPKIFAKDGMNVSLQINNGNYCTSDKGYRTFSFKWENVEFGFPENLNSESEALIAPYGECNQEEDTKLTSNHSQSKPLPLMNNQFKVVVTTTNNVTKYYIVDTQATIGVGDFFYHSDYGVMLCQTKAHQKNIEDSECYNVISSTDESLGLPTIPQWFIEDYIDNPTLIIWDLHIVDIADELTCLVQWKVESDTTPEYDVDFDLLDQAIGKAISLMYDQRYIDEKMITNFDRFFELLKSSKEFAIEAHNKLNLI